MPFSSHTFSKSAGLPSGSNAPNVSLMPSSGLISTLHSASHFPVSRSTNLWCVREMTPDDAVSEKNKPSPAKGSSRSNVLTDCTSSRSCCAPNSPTRRDFKIAAYVETATAAASFSQKNTNVFLRNTRRAVTAALVNAEAHASTCALWSPTVSNTSQRVAAIFRASSVRASAPDTKNADASPARDANASSVASTSLVTCCFNASLFNARRMDSPNGPTVSWHHSAVFTIKQSLTTASATRCETSRVLFECFETSRRNDPASSAFWRSAAAYARSTRLNAPCNARRGLPFVRFEHRLNTFLMFKKTAPALPSTSPDPSDAPATAATECAPPPSPARSPAEPGFDPPGSFSAVPSRAAMDDLSVF
mmetsp:Transcript_2033/g.8029  ORF Transcript_2033/g.8029 Transcript_2033/m.8029 type:complete len:363 (+) Transcript_2033:626-1714(+)